MCFFISGAHLNFLGGTVASELQDKTPGFPRVFIPCPANLECLLSLSQSKCACAYFRAPQKMPCCTVEKMMLESTDLRVTLITGNPLTSDESYHGGPPITSPQSR